MSKAIPTDVYEDGNLIRIEFHKLDGEHIIDVVWDSNDEQTSANREAFRKWAYRSLGQMDYKVDL
jgi:hypothetical protein